MDPGLIRLLLAAGLVLAGIALAIGVVRSFLLRRRERRDGTLLSVDRSRSAGPSLSSEEFRLAGRPDGLRRLPDGREVPIELKHRPTPGRGPLPSHRIQVLAYCLLVESSTGRAPPYGVLRYSDGGEFRIAWDRAARSEVLELLAGLRRPYRGEATPGPARCARCAWRDGCDVRAAGA
jgi:CRISPR-associated exonuclease Cas4